MRNQLIIRQAAFQGPAGAQGAIGATGAVGPQGATGAAGVVILDSQTASATLTNVTVSTDFSITKQLAANYLVVGKILRIRAAGRWTTTGAQGIAFYVRLGTLFIQIPTVAIAGNDTGSWDADTEIICTTAGAGGAVQMTSRINVSNTAGTINGTFTKSTGSQAIDTTATQTIRHSFAATVATNTAVEDIEVIEAFN